MIPGLVTFFRRMTSSSQPSAAADVIRAIADLRSPQAWFPTARRIRRKWIVHIGPTNSGKTYQALRSLAEANNGVYCGPLRLLAWEVHEKLCDGLINGRRVACDLLTGQEQVYLPDSRHRASTIEMVDLNDCVDVGVIDEVGPPHSESTHLEAVPLSFGLDASYIITYSMHNFRHLYPFTRSSHHYS